MSRIIPHLWYSERAPEAAAFYAAIFPDSRVDRVTTIPTDTPGGTAGSVEVVEFTLFGQPLLHSDGAGAWRGHVAARCCPLCPPCVSPAAAGERRRATGLGT